MVQKTFQNGKLVIQNTFQSGKKEVNYEIYLEHLL